MMVERHYDDETLLGFLEKERLVSDPHLTACGPCIEKLDTFRTISDVLHEHDVWDDACVPGDPVPATVAMLRGFADRMTFEDSAADAILPELLAGSREEWMPRLTAHPEWRTAGVVRRLVGETTRVVMTMPPDALEMTALSTEIADRLDADSYRADTLAKLAGAAWRDRAYAFFYVGRFADSLMAANRADASFRRCVVDEYDLARVAVVRALALRARQDVPAAMAAVQLSGETFSRFADATRLASARLAETHLLFTRSEFEEARRLLEDLEIRLRRTDDTNTHARVLGNLGYCYGQLGRIDDALRHNDAAAQLFEAIGIHTESTRLRWSVAAILASCGRVGEAQARLEKLKSDFDQLGMTSEAALVGLDIAELLLAKGEFAAVENTCREAMRSFETAGIAYTARALTALSYIHEAARLRTATPVLVKHVREYIRQLPQNGELLFAPPPPEARLPTSR
jgi:tetratricopeptide (TPR) repeat protein